MDLAVAHGDDLLVAGVGLDDRRPAAQLVPGLGGEVGAGLLEEGVEVGRVLAGGLEGVAGVAEPLDPAGEVGPPLGVGVVAANRLGDLGEVAHALRRDDLAQHRRGAHVDGGQHPLGDGEALAGQLRAQLLVEGRDAVVVEGGRRGAEDGHVLGLLPERLAVAHHLPADVAQGVHRTTTLELVDGDDVGEVEHVDLLELARRAELGRHHVEVDVGVRGDGGVALTDAGRLDDDEVVAGGLEDRHHVVEGLGHLAPAPGGQAAEVHAVAVEAVHPDPVAEQRPATAAAGGVDGDAGDAQLVLLVDPQPPDELVGEARLPRAAGAGDAEHRHGAGGRGPGQLTPEGLVEVAGLGGGDGPRHGRAVAGEDRLDRRRCALPQVGVAGGHDLVDHPGQAQPLTVLRAEDRDAGGTQPLDLARDDDAAAPADDLDVGCPGLAEQLDEVLEVLDVPALVRADRHALGVLVDGGVDDLLHRAVVPEVDHLGPLALHDPPHDVDRGVVAVEERGGGDDADGVGRDVEPLLGRLRCHGWVLRSGSGEMLGRPSTYREVTSRWAGP